MCHRLKFLVAPFFFQRAQGYVYIKRAGELDEVFAELSCFAGDTVARLAKRACDTFGWGVPTQAQIYLLVHAPGGDEPPAEAERAALANARLQSGWALEHAGVVPGSWLLARVPPPAAASGAFRRSAPFSFDGDLRATSCAPLPSAPAQAAPYQRLQRVATVAAAPAPSGV